ncbi:MAG: protein-(glutamine-N5) methyltransferase, release factor-specific [Robiginitomaculum sp.]|nr:MAG: protein-(glutamine-N5) methyltransferase, release factor-specific [Robiginitomaculum sp.]
MADITYGDLKHGATNMLANAGIDNPALDVRILLEKASHKSAAELIVCDRDSVSETVQTEFHELLGYRLAHEPIAYILGEKAFWSLDFKVDENVLIPRPETEGLVEQALKLIATIQTPHILDIGTGSGAIIISLLHERQSATGLGADISLEALNMARMNAERHNVGNRCHFVRSDYLKGVTGKFDLVVSNPPYIDTVTMEKLAPDVELYEPELALHGGEDGLAAYRAIITNIKDVLNPGGHLVFEIGFDQKDPVCSLLHNAGAADIACQQDLAGLDRIISATFY